MDTPLDIFMQIQSRHRWYVVAEMFHETADCKPPMSIQSVDTSWSEKLSDDNLSPRDRKAMREIEKLTSLSVEERKEIRRAINYKEIMLSRADAAAKLLEKKSQLRYAVAAMADRRRQIVNRQENAYGCGPVSVSGGRQPSDQALR